MNIKEQKITDDSQGGVKLQKKRRARSVLHEWTESEISKLVQAVEINQELWKSSHQFYKNRKKRDAAWQYIQENVFDSEISIDEITSKWNNLRVQYKSYAAKYKMKRSGSGLRPMNRWKYFDMLNFIGTNDDLTIETPISNLPLIDFASIKSTTSPIPSASDVRKPTRSSRSLRSNTFSSDTENDELFVQGIKLAVDNLNDSKNDEFKIFGQFVAAEIKRLPNDYQRQQLKRIIQRAIMDYNENIEQQNAVAAKFEPVLDF